MAVNETSQTPLNLPTVGNSRWKQIEPFLGISREKWRLLGLEGRAPRPIRLSERCTVYSNAEVLRFIQDPLNYRAAH